MIQYSEADKELYVRNQNANSSDADDHVYISGGTYSDGFSVPSGISSESIITLKSESEIFNISADAVKHLEKDENNIQKNQLNNLLRILIKALEGYKQDIPRIEISLADDNTVILHWRVGSAYFGVSIFADEKDSVWSLIETGTGARGYLSDGYLNDKRIKTHLKNAVIFLINNKISNE